MMSEFMKENVNINTYMSAMTIDGSEVKKFGVDDYHGKKPNNKVKYSEKKKSNKQSHVIKNERSGCSNNGNIAAIARRLPGHNTGKSRPNSIFVRQSETKQGSNSENHRSSSKFHIHVTQHDMEVCRQTAVRLHSVRERIAVDPLLANHLSHLVFVSNQYLFDQQRSMFFFYEQQKQAEVANWLSNKTEAERQDYIERMRAEPSTACNTFV